MKIKTIEITLEEFNRIESLAIKASCAADMLEKDSSMRLGLHAIVKEVIRDLGSLKEFI